MIDVKDVIKTYQTGDTQLQVLKGVSFKIEDGEFIAFFGPNGCGKTTFLNILSGVDKQTSGKILINQKNLTILICRTFARRTGAGRRRKLRWRVSSRCMICRNSRLCCFSSCKKNLSRSLKL